MRNVNFEFTFTDQDAIQLVKDAEEGIIGALDIEKQKAKKKELITEILSVNPSLQSQIGSFWRNIGHQLAVIINQKLQYIHKRLTFHGIHISTGKAMKARKNIYESTQRCLKRYLPQWLSIFSSYIENNELSKLHLRATYFSIQLNYAQIVQD